MPNHKATKALQKRSDAALESFHKYYAGIWGEERWLNTLYPALSNPTRYCALINLFGDASQIMDELRASGAEAVEIESLLSNNTSNESSRINNRPYVMVHEDQSPFAAPKQVPSKCIDKTVLSHWNLDYASVLAASMLQVQSGEKALDLCAAPGGKSIVLAQMLWPSLYFSKHGEGVDKSMLHSNEMDTTRHKRLLGNMQSYLPQQLFESNAVDVVRIDGSAKTAVDELLLGACGYDKALVDAPCSSERHIIQAHIRAIAAGQVSEEMSNWKSSHTKTLAKTQLALLMTALKAVRVGGTVLYATCSLSTEENDMVVERAIEAVKKLRKDDKDSTWKIRVVTENSGNPTVEAALNASTEKTTHGRIALPDHISGGKWGPLYFSLLQKVARKTKEPA